MPARLGLTLGMVLATILLPACAGQRREPPPTATLSPRSLVDLDATPGMYRPYDPAVAAEMLRTGMGIGTSNPNGPRRKILALSGGGMFGAYTAGVLKGWTASGRRPVFDIVTGISTGALIAPLAFLGPEYDDALEAKYTTIKTSDIYQTRSLLALPFADALTDSSPLRRLIQQQIDETVLDKVAAAHAQGRRLYIGTTNLDNKQLIVWDMGAIASSPRAGRLALFQNVILASAAFPGVLPPVSIDIVVNGEHFRELHADGGVVASIFVDISMLSALEPNTNGLPGPREGADVYALVAGKLYNAPGKLQRKLFSVAEESLNGVLQARSEGDLLRIYLLSTLSGGQFNLASVPQDLDVGTNFLSFDSDVMRKLFKTGFEFGSHDGPWRKTPPGGAWNEQRLPRSGVYFATEEHPAADPRYSRESHDNDRISPGSVKGSVGEIGVKGAIGNAVEGRPR